MNPRSGLILRVLVLTVLVLMAFSPAGCVGCSSEGPSVRDSIEATFPDRADDVFSSENAFVTTRTGEYEPSRADGPLSAIISASSPPEIRLTGTDDFSVKLRPMHEGIRPEIVDGAIVYDFAGGAEIWTARNGGYEVTLFLEAGFVDNKPFQWNWQVSGAKLRLDGERVEFVDAQNAVQMQASILKNSKASIVQHFEALPDEDSHLVVDIPPAQSAILVQLFIESAADKPVPPTNIACVNGTCPPGFICINNECLGLPGIPCAVATDCQFGFCEDGVCCTTTCPGECKSCFLPGTVGSCAFVPANSPDPTVCENPSYCDGNGTCKHPNGHSCSSANQCQSSFCADGVCCDAPCTGTCLACSLMGSVGTCTLVGLGATDPGPNSTCNGSSVCDGMGNCKVLTGQSCLNNNQCLSGFCADGVCCNAPCTETCRSCNLMGTVGTCTLVGQGIADPGPGSTCEGDSACDGNGICKVLLGKQCTNGAQCLSSSCVDGVCCSTLCDGTCRACSNVKTGAADGTCAFITNGTDPDSDCSQQPSSTCGTTGLCNGAGSCSLYANNTVCASAVCTDSITLQNADLCDGTGSCVDKSTTNCSPYICSGTACLTTCSTNMHCVSGAFCDTAMMKCVTKKANGATCSSVLECQSNFCVDGVCCDSICSGVCMSCAVSGGQGTCLPVLSGQNDNTCQGANQACDGNGSCKKAIGQSCAMATECTSNACVDGFCCNTTCTGDCQACSIAKKGAGNQQGNGYCENVAAGTDPNNNCMAEPVTSCGNNGFCDGMGQCQKFSTSTICAASSCLDADTLKGPNLCDGNGFCATGETECSPYLCKTNACKTTCASNMDCIADAYCEMAVCVPKKADGQACANAGQCISGQCVDGVCCATAMCPDCQACNLSGNGTCSPVPAGNKDGLCSTADKACDGLGVCKKINGQSCAASADCVTDNCVDGVCCNTACITPCQACNVAGNIGICSNVPSGQDDGTCTGADVACDGNGECKKELGQTCSSATECLVGKCVDGVCCNTDCTETCKACNLPNSLGLCTFVPENGKDPLTCNTSTVSCNGAGECVKSLGEGCTTDMECSSKHCADGVCCDVECGIDCQSCNVQGSVGICTAVPENQQDGACMNGKACNGSGKCMVEIGKKCGVGTQCLSGFCFNQVCCDAQCSGSCQACSIAAGATADGTCTALSNTPCDDGNACTTTDVCQTGTCMGNDPVLCADPGECQNEGACNPTTGVCEYSDQGPECTAGKNTTGGGCVCSLTGERTSNRDALFGMVGLLLTVAWRKRNSRSARSTCSRAQ